MTTEFQCYGIHKDGSLAFAGIRHVGKASPRTANRIVRDWLKWATTYVAEREDGDFPLADAVRRLPVNPVVELRMQATSGDQREVAFSVVRKPAPLATTR